MNRERPAKAPNSVQELLKWSQGLCDMARELREAAEREIVRKVYTGERR